MKQLIFFQRTAELEHMTKAAEQLMVAQPFLSKTIAALEEELGVPLFDHVGRKIQLNDYGKIFYRRVQQAFAALDDAKRELNEIALLKEEEVTIVTNASLYMPGLLSFFRKRLPEAQFHQVSAPRSSILKMLHSGTADFAICTPAIYEDPELETTVLIDEVCPIIYPSEHWLKDRREVSLKELENEPFVSANPGYGIRDLTESFFERVSIHPKIIVESTDTSSIPSYIKNGIGIAFSPLSPLLQDPVLRNRYIEVSDPPCIGVVGLSWKKGRYLTRTCEHFLRLASAYFSLVDPNFKEYGFNEKTQSDPIF